MGKTIVKVDKDLEDLIPQFILNRKKDIEELIEAIEKKDEPLVAQLGHKIKGSSASYGFEELSKMAADCEIAAKNKNLVSVSHLLPKMRAHFDDMDIRYEEM